MPKLEKIKEFEEKNGSKALKNHFMNWLDYKYKDSSITLIGYSNKTDITEYEISKLEPELKKQ